MSNPSIRLVDLDDDKVSRKPLSIQGLSPVMHKIIELRSNRAQSFTNEILGEMQSAALAAANKVADKHGFSVDSVAMEFSDEVASLKIDLSILDALGFDRYMRCLLEKGASVGLEPASLGANFKIPRNRNNPDEGDHDIIVTGLIPLNEDKKLYKVRLYDLSEGVHMHASPHVVQLFYKRFCLKSESQTSVKLGSSE